MTRTYAPRCGSYSTSPSWTSWRIASRTALRPVPSVPASDTSRSASPCGMRPSMIASRSSRRTCSVMDARSTLERRQVFAWGATGLLRWTVDNHTIWCCRGSRAVASSALCVSGAGVCGRESCLDRGPRHAAGRDPGSRWWRLVMPVVSGPRTDHAAQYAPSRHPRVMRPLLTMLRANVVPSGVRDRPPRGTSPPRSWRRAVLPYCKAAELAPGLPAVAFHGSSAVASTGGATACLPWTAGDVGSQATWRPCDAEDGRSSPAIHPSRAARALVPHAGGDGVGSRDRAPGRFTRGWRDGAYWAAWSPGPHHPDARTRPSEASLTYQFVRL